MTIILNGKKCYPVGRWNSFQHVFYNYCDRTYLRMCDLEDDAEATVEEMAAAEEAHEEANRLLDVWNNNVQRDGLVYATYADYCKMKDIIGGYVLRHR